MPKKIGRISGSIFVIFMMFLAFVPALPIEAEDDGYGLGATKEETEGLQEGDPEVIVGNIIGAVLAFVGVLFFVLVIYGGLLWMTARGNEQQIEKAKNLIGAAVIGLIIILSAYAITSFIGTALTE